MSEINRDNNTLMKRLQLDITDAIDSLRREFPDEAGSNRAAKRLFELIDRLSVLRENDYSGNPEAMRILSMKIDETEDRLHDALKAETGGIKKL